MNDHTLPIDAGFMARAIELAVLGLGRVSPNPLVGCVIVHEGRIIGEGWHRGYGEAHAEVAAVQSLSDTRLLAASTVYVTLEPCTHFGKTPPCADMLIEHGVQRVVIGSADSNPKVTGGGAAKLKAAGIEVVTGVLEEACRYMNRRFFTFVEQRRPYIILKWAETSDRYIARLNRESKWISDKVSRQLVHRWRAEEDAILVGSGTAEADNPRLTVRDWTGRNPIRILIDRKLRLGSPLHLFDGAVQTIVYNTIKSEETKGVVRVKLSEQDFLNEMMADLHSRNVQSLIVEGGARTLKLFIEAGLWDEARVFRSPQLFGSGIPAPQLVGQAHVGSLSVDQLFYYTRHPNPHAHG
ncbi:MAG: bifunctional diaminohydroxyphosphoribosylaminopyrimidine deaminase/5-amino-6-(5-phosphoribosylamino)uracil reductase RibD [Cyclobacteriaceae bacterium]|jgi:diaminohydroxyphosphoribosylaminopyrimidine deaminase/5-amino-6-(5-phosphoribosylamino)uracil reductase|nr:bifunctional diaminohydroxyphosphoribosylaminopyrimidine deaminase/5-amino-6-(5-phosphoribosylamino)uracil reductase RibD [Cyclobacteriaceae bacterium]